MNAPDEKHGECYDCHRYRLENERGMNAPDEKHVRQTCPDCGCLEGDFHTSECTYELRMPSEYPWPYFEYPYICARCGELWPDFFTVPEEEWAHYIDPTHWGTVLCLDCYNLIADIRDQAERARGINPKPRAVPTIIDYSEEEASPNE